MHSTELSKPIEKMSSQSISPEQSYLLSQIHNYIIFYDWDKELLINSIKNFKDAGHNINDKIRYNKLEKILKTDRECCNPSDRECYNPLQIAIAYIFIYNINYNINNYNINYYDIIKILLDNGSDINILDIENNSLLHGCIMTLDLNLLEYLLNNTNIDINIKNKDNKNAFELCEHILGDNNYIQNLSDNGKMTENELKDILKKMRDLLYIKMFEKDLNYWELNKLPDTLINNMIN